MQFCENEIFDETRPIQVEGNLDMVAIPLTIWAALEFGAKISLIKLLCSLDHNDIMVGGGNMLLLSLVENFNGEATIEASNNIFQQFNYIWHAFWIF